MFGDVPRLGGGGSAARSEVYPLAEYGFIAASGWPVEAFGGGNSPLGSWHVRVPVPTDKPLTKIGVLTSTAGTLAAGGLNAFAVYSDDGQTQLGAGATDNNLYTAAGWVLQSLSAQIPPVAAGWVRVLLALNGYSASPNAPFAIVGPSSGAAFSGGNNKPGHLRSAFVSIATFPASFTPASYGTATQYMPLIVVG